MVNRRVNFVYNIIMKTRSVSLPIIIFLIFGVSSAQAQIRLPDIFSNNMVLQQKTTIKFWGWANPMQKIKVVASWNSDTLKTVTLSNAVWSVQLQTPKAGGPYRISVIGNSVHTISNVLIGEDWLCSGQSNMEYSADWHYEHYKQLVEKANNSEIRFFKVDKISAPYPQELVRGSWKICTPQSMRSFSLIGYYFGSLLNKRLGEPIGLIESSWGGTPVEAWTPINIFHNNSRLATSSAKLIPVPWCPVKPAVTYNAMIYPLRKFNIAGVIWYQGEENTANPSTYQQTFGDMIHSWRELWHKQFPFYFVQIAPYEYDTPYSAALVREAQLKTYKTVTKTGIVVTTDITGDTTNIHPLDKKDVGNRLALWALAKTYGKSGVTYSGPIYQSLKVNGNKAVIYFDYAMKGLMKKGRVLRDFVIAGIDHHFVKAIAKIKGKTVIVYSPKVSHPVAVRMGFSNTAIPNLFNKSGLPASPFRTDDWPVDMKKK